MQTTEEDIQNFTVALPRTDWLRLKIQAAKERRRMSQVVRDAIRSYLDLFEGTGK